MFEIHYHLLFGIDDGPGTIEDAIALAEASIGEGVTHIVCTPHASDRYPFQPEMNAERIAALREQLGGRVTLGLGCDFHLSFDNIEDLNRDHTKYTINGKQFLLVEFPSSVIPHGMDEALFRMIASGIVPIITHPERNPALVANPDRMVEWLRRGCLVQVTAGSLSGYFGKRAESMSRLLLERNWVHFVASDAHSMGKRPPAMASAFEFLKTHYGIETAERLCIHNPKAAFFGTKMPDQPKLEGLDGSKTNVIRFFQRIFKH